MTIHFLEAVNGSNPIEIPNQPASDLLNPLYQPWFWGLIALAALVFLFWPLHHLSKKRLFVALFPGMAVNVTPRHPGLIFTSHSGRLVLPLPFVAFVWYGGICGLSIHSLFHSSITHHSTSATIVIPLSEIHPSESNPNPPYPTPNQPNPAVLRDSVAHRQDCPSGHHLDLEHLEIWRAQAYLGIIGSQSTDSLVDEESPFAFSVPSTPEHSYSNADKGHSVI